MKTFVFHQDPGHGWLQVSVSDIIGVGLTLNDFTTYSYQDGRDVFLEEDRDMQVFIEAYKDKYMTMPDIHDNVVSSTFIRNLNAVASTWRPAL